MSQIDQIEKGLSKDRHAEPTAASSYSVFEVSK